jgi:hypothetical protein
MAWHNLFDAVNKTYLLSQTHGAHVFYWPECGFMVIRDSQNGEIAREKIMMAPEHYCGYFRAKIGVELTQRDVLDEILFSRKEIDDRRASNLKRYPQKRVVTSR